MPGIIQGSPFKTITVTELHPTFGAEICGVDFSSISDETFSEIEAAMAKYGFCVFRNTGLDDEGHVEFSRRFGELDDIKPYMTNGRKPRFEYYELFDAGNIDDQGNVVDPDSARAHYNRGNNLFHVDSSFNPRRASFSILHACALPPGGTGGDTQFADSRTAFDDLPADFRQDLITQDYTIAHSLAHSRKTASPDFFASLDPLQQRMARHKLIQEHEPSGRMNIYIAAHAHHVVGLDEEKSRVLLQELLKHVTQKKYVTNVQWENLGDLVMWDNRCVLHRGTGGSFEGKYKRDLRRTTVHDSGSYAWGENERGEKRPGFALGLTST